MGSGKDKDSLWKFVLITKLAYYCFHVVGGMFCAGDC